MLDHAAAVDAIAAGDAGAVVRLARQARGWTQRELALKAGYSQPTISRVERGQTRANRDIAVLVDLANSLGIPTSAVGVAAVDAPGTAPTLDDVHRRELLTGAVGLAIAALLPPAVATPTGRIGAVEVAQCWASLRRLYELDHREGGRSVYQLAEGLAVRLRDALRQGTYRPTVGRELQACAAMAMDHTGWAAFDAGLADTAWRWWLEASHLADLAGYRESRVRALAAMTLYTGTDPSRGRETVALAEATRAAAGAGPAPALLSVLAAREALGHAQIHDRAAATKALSAAYRHLDRGATVGELQWLSFWGAADLSSHESRVALALGDLAWAEAAARAAVSTVHAERHPRNRALYTTDLGALLIQTGQCDEAIAVTGDALNQVLAVGGSLRAIRDLREAVGRLGRQTYAPARHFALAARERLPAVS